MRIAASIAVLSLWAIAVVGCGSPKKSRYEELEFAEPNKLVSKEIEERIAEIPYQHRDELFHNLLWLGQQGEQSITLLLDGLGSGEPKVRSNCAWVLGQIGDRRTIEFLRPLARDDNQAVRLEAARALVGMGDVGASPALIEGLDSDKIEVRYGCHETLKRATKRDFGYDHLEEDPSMRRVSVLQWRQWWSDQANDPWFAKEYAEEFGLSPTEDAGDGAMPDANEQGELEAGEWATTPPSPGGETNPNGGDDRGN